jgi:hypothetical protein
MSIDVCALTKKGVRCMSIDCIGMLPGEVSMKPEYRGKYYVRCNVCTEDTVRPLMVYWRI